MRAIIITIVIIIIILITIIIICTDERGTRMDELLRTCLQFRLHQGHDSVRLRPRLQICPFQGHASAFLCGLSAPTRLTSGGWWLLQGQVVRQVAYRCASLILPLSSQQMMMLMMRTRP